MVIKNLKRERGEFMVQKNDCGSKASLGIIVTWREMASSTHLNSNIFCVSHAGSFNVFNNQHSESFTERTWYVLVNSYQEDFLVFKERWFREIP